MVRAGKPGQVGRASSVVPIGFVAHLAIPDCMHIGARQRHVPATSRSNTSRGARKQALGRLPMRNGSRHGAAHQCESANSCICNIHHPAPVDESPPLAETFCGKLLLANFIELYVLYMALLFTLVFPSAPFVRFML
jgi:hypothetical protein